MRKSIAVLIAGGLAALALPLAGVASAQAAGEPTCSDLGFLGIEVHGQHIIRDYVAGGGAAQDWPPSDVGSTVGGNGGAALPGGAGPGFHFPNQAPPGASFCTNSQSFKLYDHLPDHLQNPPAP